MKGSQHVEQDHPRRQGFTQQERGKEAYHEESGPRPDHAFHRGEHKAEADQLIQAFEDGIEHLKAAIARNPKAKRWGSGNG